jgi:hypothetical protein
MALLLAWMAIGGCASSKTAPSSSPATEDGAKNRDTMECMNVAREVRSSPQGPRTTIDQDRYQQCMRERGHVSAPTR